VSFEFSVKKKKKFIFDLRRRVLERGKRIYTESTENAEGTEKIEERI
jgi:hypothetical protein